MGGSQGEAARSGAAARGCVRALRQNGPSAPACRGMEIHRPARVDARGQAACGRRRMQPRRRVRRMRAPLLSDIDARRLVFVGRRLCAGAVGSEQRSSRACRSARWRRRSRTARARERRLGKIVPTTMPLLRSTRRSWATAWSIHVAPGAAIERPIHLVFASIPATSPRPCSRARWSIVEQGARSC